MHRTRRLRRSSARPSFALPLLLALLSMVCVPGLAHAEEGSAGIEYESKLPTAGGNGSTAPSVPQVPQGEGAKAKKSNVEPGVAEEGTGGETEEGTGNSEKSGAGPAGGGGDKGSKPGGQSGGSKPEGKTGIGDSKPIASASGTPVASKSTADDGGGSSPIVPILIAVAILAAASIGYVFYRQRRQGGGPGSPVSPKAS